MLSMTSTSKYIHYDFKKNYLNVHGETWFERCPYARVICNLLLLNPQRMLTSKKWS